MNDHDGVLTHLDEQGAARMVDVSAKAVTLRRARASGARPYLAWECTHEGDSQCRERWPSCRRVAPRLVR